MDFVHLHVHTEFSFLDGAARHDELLARAKALGMPALAVTDHGLYGVVRFYQKAREFGIKPLIGCEVSVEAGNQGRRASGDQESGAAGDREGSYHLTLLARSTQGYTSLCRLLTAAAAGRPATPSYRSPPVAWQHLAEQASDLIALSGCRQGEVPSLIAQGQTEQAVAALRRYQALFGAERFYLELQNYRTPENRVLLRRLAAFGQEKGVPLVATNNVHYLEPLGYRLHEVLAAIRTLTPLEAGSGPRSMEQYLKSPAQMARLFREWPQAIANTQRIAAECQATLPLGQPQLPAFPLPEGETAFSLLYKLAFAGATWRYRPLRPEVARRLQEEVEVIHQLGLSDYFLLVWDIVQFARRAGIRCSGRGSGADSLICYCLGITQVDPLACHLPFGRFLSLERREMPDIDLDCDSTRRDEVLRYVYERYGGERVAMVATVNTFRARGAVREVAKVLGYAPGEIARLTERLPHIPADQIGQAMATLPELQGEAGTEEESLSLLWQMAEQMDGLPTHLSVHVGGVIVGPRPLAETMPLQEAAKGVVIAAFDKDDVEALGFVKLDILSLRSLAAIQYAVELIEQQHGQRPDLEHLPLDDPKVYALLASGQTVGVFQLESPGQRELQRRLLPREFFDIVCAVSLFRPGPVQGEMVEPFLRRRHGQEKATYLHPALEPILKETYGVVLFQEQVLEVAHAVAGFTHGEADLLRRAMTHDRSAEEMARIEGLFVAKAVARGVTEEVAGGIFRQLRGFAAYGFCRAHAQSFALLAYQTAWLKVYYPAEFFAALLTHQPGMYPPGVLLHEARRCGVGVLPLNVNHSSERYTVEQGAIRLSLAQLKGMSRPALCAILQARETGGPFVSLRDFCQRVRLERPIMEDLIRAGAFRSLEASSTRSLLWELPRLFREDNNPIPGMPPAALPSFPLTMQEEFQTETSLLGFSPENHPLDFYRAELRQRGVVRSGELAHLANGMRVEIAGQVVGWQTPPTKSGQRVIFLTLEDEDGLIQVVIFPRAQERCVPALYSSSLLLAQGTVQRRGGATTIIAEAIKGVGL